MKTVIFAIIGICSAALFLSPAHGQKKKEVKEGIMLMDLKPSATEWGTDKHDMFPDWQSGPQTVEWGPNGNSQSQFWSDDIKVVKSYAKDFKLGEGKSYSSTMPDCFAVGGEFMTGVGLWSRRMTFYHWIEYAIPAGVKEFSAEAYVTDDPRGFAWWGGETTNQQFDMKVFIDDKEVTSFGKTRLAVAAGSGELLETISFGIPAGAKKIKFRLQNSAWGDGNSNTEIVLKDAKFTK